MARVAQFMILDNRLIPAEIDRRQRAAQSIAITEEKVPFLAS